jgi:hypothetical protein
MQNRRALMQLLVCGASGQACKANSSVYVSVPSAERPFVIDKWWHV